MEPVVNNEDLSVKYNEGVVNRDPLALMDVAKEGYGTPISDAAINSADIIYKTGNEFNKLVTPIEKAGGVQTPEGRVAAADTWKTVKDNPQWGDALMMYLMGDKAGAAAMVTGGAVKSYTTYDQAGRQLRERRNALGEIVNVTDLESGQTINPQEYGKRGGGLVNWETTLGGIKAKETAKKNTELLNDSITRKNAWATAIDANLPAAKEVMRLGSIIKGLDGKVQSKIWEAGSRTAAEATNIGKTKQFFKQSGDTLNLKDGEEVSKNYGYDAGLGKGPIVFDAKTNTLRNTSTGDSVSINKLKNDMSSDTSSKNLETAFKQDQENLAQYLLTSGLDADKQAEVIRYFQLSNQMAKEFSKLETKHDKPAFLASLPDLRYSDPVKMGTLISTSVLSNKDVMDKNMKFFNNSIKNYEKGEVPNPNEIDSAFTKNPSSGFVESMDNLSNAWRTIMSMPSAAKELPATEETKKAVPPKQSMGKAPMKKEEKKVKRSLSEIFD